MNRRVFLARAGAVAAGAASVSLVGVGAANALGPPDLLQVPVRLRRLDPAFNGFRIAVVSDIHLGPLSGRAHTERIVRMINETAPDLVAIVGDLVDGTVEELGPAAEPLRDLDSREGTFFVTGNHEYFVEDPLSWLRELERLGVQPLRNENTAIRRGAAAFDLAGVNDIAGESRSDAPDFDRALSGLDSSRPTVLLAHQPVLVEEAAARGVDLQLSGHTHGGQMWPFHYIVRARTTVPRRIVHGGQHAAVRLAGRGVLGSAGAGRRATGHHRAIPPGRGLGRIGIALLLICRAVGVVERWGGFWGRRGAAFGEQRGRHRSYMSGEVRPKIHQRDDLLGGPARRHLHQDRSVVAEHEHRPFGHVKDLLAALTGQLGVERDLADLVDELVMPALASPCEQNTLAARGLIAAMPKA